MSGPERHGLILVCSDSDAGHLGEFVEMVAQCHIQLDSATDWADAIRSATESEPLLAVVVSPPSSALDQLQALVAALDLLPVLVLQESDSPVEVDSLLSIGCADVLSLPVVDMSAVMNRFQRHVRRAGLMAESDDLRSELEQSLALLKEDQQAGRHVQRKMLPPQDVVINDYRFEYRIKPSLFLSGDFIDFFRISESLSMFYLADISGHGASSAFVTVLLKNMTNRLLRNYNRGSSFHILSPTDVLSRINKELLDTGLGKHLTIFVGLLDRIENTLQYGVGGHYPMPILQQNGKAEFLPGSGMPVGLFDDAEFDGRIVELENQFCLTLFSDGILEVLNQPNLQAKEKVLLDAAARGYRDLTELAEILGVDQVGEAPDDIAALSVSRVV